MVTHRISCCSSYSNGHPSLWGVFLASGAAPVSQGKNPKPYGTKEATDRAASVLSQTKPVHDLFRPRFQAGHFAQCPPSHPILQRPISKDQLPAVSHPQEGIG